MKTALKWGLIVGGLVGGSFVAALIFMNWIDSQDL